MKLLFLLAILPFAFCQEGSLRPAPFRSGYIIGGSEAKPGDWPWQASLQKYGQHSCGASLISARWLVTAAHCVGSSQSAIRVVLGMHDLKDEKQGEPTEYMVSKIIKHYLYMPDGYGFPNDIALMQLSQDANLDSEFISTIGLPESIDLFEGQTDCYITGWGKTGAGTLSSTLQQAKVGVYTKTHCVQKWGGRSIGDYHVCVGSDGKGSCNGDSGGPLVCPKNGGKYVLVGATSWGASSCSTEYPSIYSSVAWFRYWIQYHTGV